MMQGKAGNGVTLKADHPIASWIKLQARSLATSGKDRTLWPDFIEPAPNPTLQHAATDFALIGRKAVFCDPVALWGDAASPACNSCVNCPGKGQRGVAAKMRKVCSMDTTYFTFASKYRHKQCSGEQPQPAQWTQSAGITGGCNTCKGDASIIT
jgi:hypothetical protein